MKRLLLIFSVLVISNGILAQAFEITYGEHFHKSKIETLHPEYARTYWSNFPIVKVRGLFSPLKEVEHVFSVGFSSYGLLADIEIGTLEDVDNNLHTGLGTGKTRSYDLGIGYGYELGRKRFRFLPQFICNIQYSDETWGPGVDAIGMKHIYGYEYFSYSNPGWQVFPELLLKTNYRLFYGVNAIFEVSYLQGYRPHMVLETTYTVNDEFIETAKTSQNSTGWHVMIGVGYDFGWKKDL